MAELATLKTDLARAAPICSVKTDSSHWLVGLVWRRLVVLAEWFRSWEEAIPSHEAGNARRDCYLCPNTDERSIAAYAGTLRRAPDGVLAPRLVPGASHPLSAESPPCVPTLP